MEGVECTCMGRGRGVHMEGVECTCMGRGRVWHMEVVECVHGERGVYGTASNEASLIHLPYVMSMRSRWTKCAPVSNVPLASVCCSLIDTGKAD